MATSQLSEKGTGSHPPGSFFDVFHRHPWLLRYLPLFLSAVFFGITSLTWVDDGLSGAKMGKIFSLMDMKRTMASGEASLMAGNSEPDSHLAIEPTSLKHLVFGIASCAASWPARRPIIRQVNRSLQSLWVSMMSLVHEDYRNHVMWCEHTMKSSTSSHHRWPEVSDGQYCSAKGILSLRRSWFDRSEL